MEKELENLKEEVTANEQNKNSNKTKKRKKLWFIIIPILLIIIGIIAYYLYLTIYTKPTNVTVKNNGYHKINITWDYLQDDCNYKVIISSKEFVSQDILEELKANKTLDENYEIIDIQNKKEIEVDNVLSNTDYYIAVIAYREINGKEIYSNLSEIVMNHTEALEIQPINDLSANEITDKNIKLKWTNWTTQEKNLDDTDIEITYTLFLVNMENNELTEIQANIQENEYSITELNPFTKYYYTIVINAIVDGQLISSEQSPILETMTKSEAITNLVAKSEGTSSISVTWDNYEKKDVKNDDGSDVTVTYSIYGSDSNDGEYKLLSENITETKYLEEKLPENKTRYYYVIANVMLNNEKYESVRSENIHATTEVTKRTNNNFSSNSSSTSGSSTVGSTTGSSSSSGPSKTEQARAVAKQIAQSITGSTDLEKVSKAAQIVSSYYNKGVHKETGDDYYTAYGVFIKGEASCAGCTRALGMVLEYMGYSWKHANENQWTHQWVIVTMDGQVGYADGQIGWAGYGSHPLI